MRKSRLNEARLALATWWNMTTVGQKKAISLFATLITTGAGMVHGAEDTPLLALTVASVGLLWAERSGKSIAIAVVLLALGVMLSLSIYLTDRSLSRTVWSGFTGAFVTYFSGNATGCSLIECIDTPPAALVHHLKEALEHSVWLPSTVDGLELWETPLGRFYNPSGNPLPLLVAEQMAGVYGDVKPGDVVLDCGANVGTFTRLALNHAARLVVAIELDDRNIHCLRNTFAQEIEEGKVIVVPKGVWHETATMTVHTYDNSALNSLVMSERAESPLPPKEKNAELTTIDAIVGELDLETVDFIKIDVEGAERNALRGAEHTIRRFKPRLAIATENLADDVEVVPVVVGELDHNYERVNGPCIRTSWFQIRPEVLYFRQPQ